MEDLKKRLIESARELDRLGLSKIGPGKGSFSVRNPETGEFYITPSGKKYTEITENDVVVLDKDGNPLTGGKASVDFIFHKAIYDDRPEINAVIHLHSPYATCFALLNREIPVYMQVLANTIGGSIPVSEFALPGTKQLGENIVKAMNKTKNAVIMANHGLVLCEKTPEKATVLASTVEDAAQASALALIIGKPVQLSDEQIQGALNFYKNNF